MLPTVLFALFALTFAGTTGPNLRLIDFGPNQKPQWMPESEVEKLILAPVHNFMDITDHQNLSAAGLKARATATYPSQPTHKDFVEMLKRDIDLDMLRKYNDMLSNFFTRYYKTDTGAAAAGEIFREFSNQGASNPNVAVEHFPHSWPQSSVIARIEGNGPLKDEIVILGAHEDSVGRTTTGRSPGADDDGSGTCTLLEIWRVLMKHKWVPNRTVELHTYSGEEAGLLGSQAIASAYQKEGKKVYSMMQLDMTMYPGKTGSSQFGVVTDFVNPDLTAFLRILVDTYSKLNWVDTKCGYACSDHASWTRAGFPSCFPFEGPFSASSPYIHSDQDTLSTISLEHGAQFAYVALGYLVELAS